MWRESIFKLSEDCRFNPPAAFAEILAVEKALAVTLPDELKDLLKETNGVSDKYGSGLIWSAERIQDDNMEFRTISDFKDLYMPFDHLLFFADAGNGDQFAFTILNDEIRRNDVFVWNHEDDSRTWAANSLKHYLELWLSGKLEI